MGYTVVSSGTEIAYEAATQRIVVIAAGTTAEFDGSSSTWSADAGSVVRRFPSLAHDRVNRRAVLFGGQSPGAAPSADLWAYDAPGHLWVVVTPTGG